MMRLMVACLFSMLIIVHVLHHTRTHSVTDQHIWIYSFCCVCERVHPYLHGLVNIQLLPSCSLNLNSPWIVGLVLLVACLRYQASTARPVVTQFPF